MAAPTRKRSPLRRVVRALVVFVATPYLAILVLLAVFQRSLIYVPTHDEALNVRPAAIRDASVEAITCNAADNLELHGWYIRAQGKSALAGEAADPRSQDTPVILYFCGNAGNRAYRVAEFEIFAELGADAICFDYRGYGDNAGSPSEE